MFSADNDQQLQVFKGNKIMNRETYVDLKRCKDDNSRFCWGGRNYPRKLADDRSFWRVNEGTDATKSQPCAMIYVKNTNDVGLNDGGCNWPRQVLCQVDKDICNSCTAEDEACPLPHTCYVGTSQRQLAKVSGGISTECGPQGYRFWHHGDKVYRELKDFVTIRKLSRGIGCTVHTTKQQSGNGYDQLSNFCKQFGGTMFSADNDQQLQVFKGNKIMNRETYVDLKRCKDDNSRFCWGGRNYPRKLADDRSFWRVNEGTDATKSQPCAMIYVKNTNDVGLNDGGCNWPRQVLCQVPDDVCSSCTAEDQDCSLP